MSATFSCSGGVLQSGGGAGCPPWGELLREFRAGLFGCLTARADALFSLGDAVLCAGGRVTDLARLSLVPEFGRGHGAVYDAVNAGRMVVGRLRVALAGVPLPAWPDGRIRLGADVSSWLRPEASTSPGRLFCHVQGQVKNTGEVVPGWPYSVVAALGPGRSSWALPLDAVRLGPDDDACAVTAAQLREVVARLAEAGRWQPGDPDIIVALDAGYNVTRLAWLLADLPVVLVARVRSGQVFWARPPERPPGARGRRLKHGQPVRTADPATWGGAAVAQQAPAPGYGTVTATAWHRVHKMVHRRSGGWEDWPKSRDLPVIEGTLIRLSAGPGRRAWPPMWLWASAPAAGEAGTAVLWQAYLRRFDIEHLFRFLKQQLGWTRPLLRDPAAADRWTWLLIACYAQLFLARELAADIPLPWQRPARGPGQPGVLTPGRVRAGFRLLRVTLGTPAGAAKTSRPGPGRPPGSKNKRKAPRYRPGKTNPKTPKKAKKTRNGKAKAG